MVLKSIFGLICIIFIYEVSIGQNLSPPLRSEISLAGNYAELRKNHFHMGLDFRTDNKENYEVFAAEDGYISRMLISPNGYGKALYINHPQLGLTTVYAHLNEFKPDIQDWLDKTQYALQVNTIDTSLSPYLFPVKKGQWIALSGNTGSSSGPHLHFEVRNMSTEKTINPQVFYPKIKDDIAPILSKIILYDVRQTSNFLIAYDKKEIDSQIVEVNSNSIGIAISTYDLMDGSPNVFGIYALRIYADDVLTYQLKFDSLDFRWQSHIKAISDYGISYKDVYKGFYEKCSFNLSDSSSENGIIRLEDYTTKKIRIEVYDFKGNMATSNFQIVPKLSRHTLTKLDLISCEDNLSIHHKAFQIEISKNGIANDVLNKAYILNNHLADNELLKLSIFSESVAVLMPFQFLYLGKYNSILKNKIYLESRVDNKHKVYIGHWQGNKLIFDKVKNFGEFTVKYDQTNPSIAPKPIKLGNEISFKVSDKDSEIGKYNLTINGQWRKIYYDEKNNQLIYKIISEDKGKKVKALLEVEDKVGNKNSKMMEILL